MQQAFRGRKTSPTHNVMAVVNFDLKLKDLSGATFDDDCHAIMLEQDHYLDHCKVQMI
jgi:hypothetical protein